MRNKLWPLIFSLIIWFAPSSQLFAEKVTPSPGLGKSALPPANGTGNITFKVGKKRLTLPLNKIEIKRMNTNTNYMVYMVFVDENQSNRAQVAFTMRSSKPGPVPDNQITGLLFKIGKVISKSNANQTKCKLVVSSFSERMVAGTGSCAPMFRINTTKSAPSVTEIKFEAKSVLAKK